MSEPVANVVALLKSAAAAHPGRLALIGEQVWTYAELWDAVDRFSVSLQKQGLRAGDRAICMVPMSAQLYVALLGLLKMGAVAVFVDPWIGMRQIASFSIFAEPRAFIGVPKSHLLRIAPAGLRRTPISVTTGARFGNFPARTAWREMLSAKGDGRVAAVSADSPALITFTSGSSGTPKGANRTHGFLMAQHRALQREFPTRDDDVDMTMFPVFALNNLARGITTVVPSMDFRNVAGIDAGRIAEQMTAGGVTTCTASPPFFDRLAERRAPLRLRRVLTGGAPVSDGQLKRWQSLWPDTEIVVVYGSTEAEPVAHMTASERLAASAAAPAGSGYCAGVPTELVRTGIIRIQKGPVPALADGQINPDEIGELVVAGNHVCRDYFRNPAAVAENKIVEKDGTVWHRMGDTGYFDGQGRFWLAGRVHSTICRAGELIHPQLVEQIAQGPGIRQLAALGLPDTRLGEKLVLVVAPEFNEFNASDLKQRVGARFPVDDIVIRAKPLPLDPRHRSKIDYATLRRELS